MMIHRSLKVQGKVSHGGDKGQANLQARRRDKGVVERCVDCDERAPCKWLTHFNALLHRIDTHEHALREHKKVANGQVELTTRNIPVRGAADGMA